MAVLTDLAGSQVVVTGASGFVGARLCNRLDELGAIVHAVSRIPRSSDNSRMRWWTGDLSDGQCVHDLLVATKPEIIFHLASAVTGNRGLDFVLPTLSANLVSSVNLLMATTRVGCGRLVMAASLEEPDEKNGAGVPCSPYAAAKWAASGYARMFHELYATPVVMARLFMIYGPGQRDLQKLVPYVTLALLRGETPRLTSGHRLIDWIYVDDIVDGLLITAVTPRIEGHSFDLGSGQLTAVRTVVEKLRTIVRADVKPRYGALSERPMERIRAADAAGTQQALGWTPAVSLEQGLVNTVNWYKQEINSGRIGCEVSTRVC